MENEVKIDVYTTLTNMAKLFALDESNSHLAFVLAASDGSQAPEVIFTGKSEELQKVLRAILSRLEKRPDGDELEQLRNSLCDLLDFNEKSGGLRSGEGGLKYFRYVCLDNQITESEDRERTLSFEDEDELLFCLENTDMYYNEEDYYNDCGFCYYDPDFDDETVRKIQLSISDAMSVFEGFLKEGSITDTDGKEYEILFVHKSPDGSCVYLIFTDNEVVENKLFHFSAKLFPEVSETTLFPLTEWEDVALRMEQMKKSMCDDYDGE